MNMIHIDFGSLLTNGNLSTLRRAIQEVKIQFFQEIIKERFGT